MATVSKTRIQNIKDQVYAIYQNIRQSNTCTDERLAIKKSTKVRERAVTRNLDAFRQDCRDQKLKREIGGLIHDVEDMAADGDTKLFVYHNVKESKTDQIEFVCVAIRKYEYRSEEVYDYCMATYSYTSRVNVSGDLLGAGLIWLGSAFAIAATGGLAAPVILAACGGGVAFGLNANTEKKDSFKDTVEARFIYELVQRGHAILEGKTLYVTHE